MSRTTQDAARTNSVSAIHWIALTLLILALIAAAPIWGGPGIVNTRGGGDSPFLFFRLQQLVANLRDGVFPARWMPDAAYGLGYPFFNYYASLPYYFAAIFNLIGFDLLVSIKIVQTLGGVFAGVAMFRWADRHFSARWAAWLAAIAYVFAPFHLVNVYVRGDSLSEFYAFIFYPLILRSIDRVLESPGSFVLLALSYGALILTHNISALIFSPFVLLYAAFRIPKSEVKSRLVSLTMGFVLAFALSAFFWLPALGEANLAQLDNQTTGYFNYAGHFRSIDLVQSSLGFDYSIDSAHTPFAMGLVQAVATVAGLIGLIITWRHDAHQRFRLFAVIGLILSTLMITPLSRPLWDRLPLLSFTQFPWRFLSIQSFFTSIVIAYLASALPLLPRPREAPSKRSGVRVSLAPVIGLTLAASTFLSLRLDYLPIRADEISPLRLQLYEAFTGNIGTTIRAEYLPHTTIPRPYTGADQLVLSDLTPRAIVSKGEANATYIYTPATHQAWQVSVGSDVATLNFPLLYWPGWGATIDAQAAEIRPAPDLGYIQLDVPRGEHRIVLRLGRTPIRSAGETISLVALLVTLAAAGAQLQSGLRGSSGRIRRVFYSPSFWSGTLIIGCAIGGAVVLQIVNALPEDWDTLTMDFADKPWLHHNPGGVDFGLARLRQYRCLAESPDGISIGMDWEVASGAAVTAAVALVAPSSHLFGGPSPITQIEIPVRTGYAQYQLRPPYRLPSGMYYVRVQVGNRVEYLYPVWVFERDHTVRSAAFGKLTPSIGLATVQAQHLDQDHLDVLLSWSVDDVVDANYGISLRLRDANGKQWTSLDTQPGYGFQPTSAWRPGTLNDAYTLSLPGDMPRDAHDTLDVILYRVASRQEVGRATVDDIRVDELYSWKEIEPPVRSFVEPPIARRTTMTFGDQIQLLGYDLSRETDSVRLNLIWKATRDIGANYSVFVHVFDPATEKIVAQSDVMPRQNAYPTSRWISGEVITDTIIIPLTNVPPGVYRIAIGVFDQSGRLPISGAVGIDAANRRVILDEKAEVH